MPDFILPWSGPPGEHLHRGLRRRGSHLLPGPLRGLRLHLLWDHPQRHAHLHSLQQVFRLLRQAEGTGVRLLQHGAHLPDQEAPEAQVQHMLRTPAGAGGLRRRDPLPAHGEAHPPRRRGLRGAADL